MLEHCPECDEPTIVGWGLTSRHVTIRVPWSERPVTVMQTASGKLRAYEEPLSIDEIAAQHADQPATPAETLNPQSPTGLPRF